MAIVCIRGRDWSHYTAGNKYVTALFTFDVFVVSENARSHGFPASTCVYEAKRRKGTILAQGFAAVTTAQTPVRPL
jgi:hypothetical protein